MLYFAGFIVFSINKKLYYVYNSTHIGNGFPELKEGADEIERLQKEMDRLQNTYEAPENYACHLEVDIGEEPDACVLDENMPSWCLYAPEALKNGGKHTCQYWRPIVNKIDWKAKALEYKKPIKMWKETPGNQRNDKWWNNWISIINQITLKEKNGS